MTTKTYGTFCLYLETSDFSAKEFTNLQCELDVLDLWNAQDEDGFAILETSNVSAVELIGEAVSLVNSLFDDERSDVSFGKFIVRCSKTGESFLFQDPVELALLTSCTCRALRTLVGYDF